MTDGELVFWLAQILVTLLVASLFVIELVRAIRFHLEHDDRALADHGMVVATGLVLIAIGNVGTSWATVIGWNDLRDFAGLCIRGTLATVAVYLVAIGRPVRLGERGELGDKADRRHNERRRHRRRPQDRPHQEEDLDHERP